MKFLRNIHSKTITLALVMSTIGFNAVNAQLRTDPSPDSSTSLVYETSDNKLIINVPSSPFKPTEVRQDGRDLLITFPIIAPTFDAFNLQSRAKRWIEGVSVGYDSVLLRLAPNTRVVASNTNSQLALTFESVPESIIRITERDSDIGGVPTDRQGALRLRLLRGHLMLRNEELAQARGRFTTLRSAMPDQTEPIVALAEVELLAGNWRKSLGHYAQAVAIEGESSELRKRRAAIERLHARRASISFETRRSDGLGDAKPTDIRQTELRATLPTSEALRFNLELDRANLVTALGQSSSTPPLSVGQTRGTIAAQHDAMSGSTAIASIFLGNDRLGFGLNYNQPDDFGSTNGNLEIARVNWDYIEGIASGALRDRISATRFQRIHPDVRGRIEIGFNRFHLHDAGSLGQTRTASAEVRLNRVMGAQGLSVTYTINGEYVRNRTANTVSLGSRFNALPLLNREIHSLSLGYYKQWALSSNAMLTLDSYAGVGKDRYGTNGELFGATVSYTRGPVELKLRLNHVTNIARTPGKTDSAMLVLTVNL